MHVLTSKNVAETQQFAREYITGITPNPDGATVVCLYGDLGSGKTTFVKEAARTLGITEIVTSPTFVIQKKYPLHHESFDHLIHIDAYRLVESGELLAIGWSDMIKNTRNIIFIEWPKYVQDVLPDKTHKLSFTFIDENTREIIDTA